MAKITTVYDGKEITLDLEGVFTAEDIEENFVPKAQHTNEVAKLNRLLTKATRSPDELLEDANFKAKALAAWKVGEMDATQVASITEGIRAREVGPLTEKLTAAESTIASLLDNDLNNNLLAAAQSVGIRPEFLTPMAEGRPAPAVAILRQVFDFGYDHDHKTHAVRNGEGFAYSSKPSGNMPYKTVAEAVGEWAKSTVAAPFLLNQKPNIPGANNRTTPVHTTPGATRHIANDPVTIGQNLEAVAKGEAVVSLTPS